jgi:DNA-binding CsgD family transcriptional regulator
LVRAVVPKYGGIALPSLPAPDLPAQARALDELLPCKEAMADVLDLDAAHLTADAPGHTFRPELSTTDATFARTHRERETLGLFCQRYTDPEIAVRLTISPRTASRHVANIFNKLGVNSRRDAAALAMARGLL